MSCAFTTSVWTIPFKKVFAHLIREKKNRKPNAISGSDSVLYVRSRQSYGKQPQPSGLSCTPVLLFPHGVCTSAFCPTATQAISDDLFVRLQFNQLYDCWHRFACCSASQSVAQCLRLVWIDGRLDVMTPWDTLSSCSFTALTASWVPLDVLYKSPSYVSVNTLLGPC